MTTATAQQVESAARELLAGGVVAFATETVYGLGANAEDARAVQAIYQLKGRPAGHPLIVHVSTLASARYWGRLGRVGEALASAFWPGPLTLIVLRHPAAPAYACGDEQTVGLRCPSHPLAQALLKAFEAQGGHGVAAPSANRFGGVSPTTAAHVRTDFGDRVTVLDGGPSAVGLESTIVDVSRGFATILRPGDISAGQINDVLLDSGLDTLREGPAHTCPDTGTESVDQPRRPRVSGSMAAHYAPTATLELVAPAQLPARLTHWQNRGKRVACCVLTVNVTQADHVEQASADPAQYGRRLYAMLRGFDEDGIEVILIEQPPTGQQWAAINDRLGRAQTGSGKATKGSSRD